MSAPVSIQGYHHATLTVSNIERSREFYSDLLGLNVIAELSPTRYVLSNGQLILAISEPPDPSQAPDEDRFNENRVGLDHVSFAVESRQEMDRAKKLLTEAGV